MLLLSLQLLHLTSLAYLHSARRHILFSAIYLHLPNSVWQFLHRCKTVCHLNMA